MQFGGLDGLVEVTCRWIERLIVAALAVMVVMVFGNVVLRYAFNAGITVSEEVSRWLFVWMTFLGAIVAVKERGHLGTDALVSRLGPGGQKACLLAGTLLMLWTTWLLLAGGWSQARINVEVRAPVTGLSMALFYAAVVVFALATGVLLLRELWRIVTGRLQPHELVMVQESEELAQVHALQLPASAPTGESRQP